MREKTLNLLKLFFGWPITIFALFFIFRIIYEKTNALSFNFAETNIFFLFVGNFCFLCYFSLRAFLWQTILLSKNHSITYKEAAYLWAVSEIRRFIPGNIWSFATRIALFSSEKIEKKSVAFAMLQEAQSTVLGSLILSVFCFSFVFYNLFPLYFVTPILLFAYTIVAFVCGLYLYKSPKKHLLFLSISSSAFFFFGLGTYFTIISFVALSPYFLLTFLSFFSLSYLTGYLSIITPMGLGVREGVMTFGLARFIALPQAAVAAIYARVILIFSELLFFFFVKMWQHAKHSYMTSFEQFLKTYWREVILAIGIGVYIVYFALASFARYDNFYTGRFDLGNMDQVVWNTSQGRIFQLTDPNGTEIISRLAFHADFFLIFLAPLYKVWPDPKLLLLVQSVVLGLGALFVYLIAKKILSNKNIALILAIIYLFNPGLQYANLYDFHSVTLVTTFLLAAFYFLLHKKYLWFLVFALLSGITKENVWIVISFFGVYIFLKEKTLEKKAFGFFLFFICMFVGYYLISIAIPQNRGGNHFALSYYSDFGDTPTTILKNVLLSPHKIIGSILQSDRITYIYQLFLPLGFISFLSPLFLIFAIPDFFIVILSNNSNLRQIYFHYTATITPFIFISAIYGVKTIKRLNPKIYQFTIYYLLFATFYGAYAFGPLPGAKNPNAVMFTAPQQDSKFISNYLSKIKKRYSVAATNNLGSHLSRRQKIFTIPVGIEKADIILFLLNDPFAQPSLAAQKKMAEDLKRNKNYVLLVEKGDFVAFQKK